jgi:anti-anti-sigma factor
MDGKVSITTQRQPESWLVLVEGDLAAGACASLQRRVRETTLLCREQRCSTIVVDLQRVDFVDSTAVGVLLEARSLLEVLGIRLVLTGARRGVRRTLKVLGLGDLMVERGNGARRPGP